jgi:hypothetical protein
MRTNFNSYLSKKQSDDHCMVYQGIYMNKDRVGEAKAKSRISVLLWCVSRTHPNHR